jgi:branched-subunit amino acid ABC-type transport system permease component
MLTSTITAAVFAAELALVALSFNFAYRVVGFANFAQVEYVTFGAYIALETSALMPMWAAGGCAVVASGLLAVVLNLSVFQRLRDASVGTRMIASAGLAIGIRAVIQYIWGVESHRLGDNYTVYTFLGTQISLVQCVIIGAAIASVIVFAAVMRFTGVGRNVRATADSPALTEVRGVRSGLVINQVWFVSGALAGLAGVLIGLDTFVRPELGTSLLVPMFAAAIVGGAGSPYGAIVGAVLVSGMSTALVSIDFGDLVGSGSYFVGSQYKSVVAFSLLIVILIIRPSGFFGERRTRV